MGQPTYPVIPQAESFVLEGSQTGILLCHGFLGTPQSVSELGQILNSRGFTVSCPRLPGHGTDSRDLERYSAADWYAEVERAYFELKRTCSTVYVVGQSMGGTLSLDLASRHADVQGLLLINPATRIPDFEQYRNEEPSKVIQEGAPDINKTGVTEITYSQTPIWAYQQLLGYLDVVRSRLGSVHCPVVCFQSLEDHVVPPNNTDEILSKVQSKESWRIQLHRSFHIASMDHDLDVIADTAVRFIENGARLADSEIYK